jgi:hypothetical protein
MNLKFGNLARRRPEFEPGFADAAKNQISSSFWYKSGPVYDRPLKIRIGGQKNWIESADVHDRGWNRSNTIPALPFHH